jgi:thiol-disulfide isomerase/thioredoxin
LTGGVPLFTLSAYHAAEVLGSSAGIDVAQLIGEGTPLILYFWHTSCGPCGAMMGFLQKLYEANKGRLLVLGVDVGPLIDEPDGRSYVRDLGVTFPVGTVDDGEETLAGYFERFLLTLFISGDGKLARRRVGFTDWRTLLESAEEMSPVTPIVDVAPGGPGRRIPYQDRDHIELGQAHPEYSSSPATSGWHYGHPNGPADWGVYQDPIPDEVLVHNLEHGGIGVHYDCPERCNELVARLRDLVTRARNEGEKVIMSPYPGLDTRITLTAWTFLDGFDEFDEARIMAFISAHESSLNAPEPFVR